MEEKSTIILLYGPSCSGKDLIKDILIRDIPYIKYLIPYTTRKPRKNEEDGKSYFFVDDINDFISDIIDKRVYHKYNETTCELDTMSYGTPLPKDDDKCSIYVAITSYEGVESFLEHSDEFNIVPVYVNSSVDVRASRYLNREAVVCDDKYILCKFGSLKEIVRRIESDGEMYNTDSITKLKRKYPNTNFYMLNNGIEFCRSNINIVVTDLKKIVMKESNKKATMQSVLSILEKVKLPNDIINVNTNNDPSKFFNSMTQVCSLLNIIGGNEDNGKN